MNFVENKKDFTKGTIFGVLVTTVLGGIGIGGTKAVKAIKNRKAAKEETPANEQPANKKDEKKAEATK